MTLSSCSRARLLIPRRRNLMPSRRTPRQTVIRLTTPRLRQRHLRRRVTHRRAMRLIATRMRTPQPRSSPSPIACLLG